MVEAAADVVVTGKELAGLIGCRPSYIVELKRHGRVVPAPQGKGYLRAASLALYADTRDPAKAGVAARHAAVRGEALAGADVDDDPPEGEAAAAEPQDSDARRKARALANKAETDAEMARLELDKVRGQLLPAAAVERLLAEAATGLRVALERIADTLAPQLAATTDEARCRQLVWDEINHGLEEASRGFRAAARAAEEGE
ncbi:hypothetical protein CSC62_07475 [Pseudoxanthomonas jiangsuensis]|uniref:hypothetical protein n=1 Tax=Pseudoxanthomonas jiangsuensis TaxID=619688 RepID=UPI001391EB9C|nr:hypothetical protein [Pseudoxanthomonas jiangsuensis]KAF1697978.1 hypothetical protein CSC62_07475 [Pseudoxanthomonas jiangsuensis]